MSGQHPQQHARQGLTYYGRDDAGRSWWFGDPPQVQPQQTGPVSFPQLGAMPHAAGAQPFIDVKTNSSYKVMLGGGMLGGGLIGAVLLVLYMTGTLRLGAAGSGLDTASDADGTPGIIIVQPKEDGAIELLQKWLDGSTASRLRLEEIEEAQDVIEEAHDDAARDR